MSYKRGVFVSKSAGLEDVGDKGTSLSFSKGTVCNTVRIGLSKDTYLGSDGITIITTESNWELQEVTSLPVTITATGYASFYAPVEVILPHGVEAYYITSDGVDADFISLNLLEGNIVPANTGVILASQIPATYELVISDTSIPTIENNLLKGTVSTANISERAYVLSNANGNTGFYLAEMNKNNASAFTNNSHEAYLPQNAIPAAMQGSTGFRLMEQPLLDEVKETITISKYGSATYCSSHNLDFSRVEGLKAYAATGYKASTGVVTLTRVMTSQSGMGLFLKGEPGEYVVPTLESTDENSLNMLVGILEGTSVNSMSEDGLFCNYRYTIKEGDEVPLFYRVDDGYTFGAGKAYLQIPVAWMPAEAKSISLRFDDGDETSDIQEIEDAFQKSEIIYDFMGRKVTNLQNSGVYIVNGKKVVW